MTKDELGNRVIKLRNELGLSQLELAAQCDIAAGHIANIETGTGNPTLSTINKIAEGFGMTASELLADKEPVVVNHGEVVNRLFAYVKNMDDETQHITIDIVKQIHQVYKRNKPE